MKELIKKQVLEDYKKVLSTEAGRRVLGGIFYGAGLNRPSGTGSDYANGKRDLALHVANTVREVDPLGVAKCEMEHAKFREKFEGRNGEDDGGSGYDDGDEYYE